MAILRWLFSAVPLLFLTACPSSRGPGPSNSPDGPLLTDGGPSDADPAHDAPPDDAPVCRPGWRDDGPQCDIPLHLGYLPPWGELAEDARIDGRVGELCGVESCGCAGDLFSPAREFDCFCTAAAECRPAHLRVAAGAAVGPCWADYLVVPFDDGCVFERSRGCALEGPPSVERFRTLDCSVEARGGFNAFADPLSDPIYLDRFEAAPAVIERGSATILTWDIDPAAAYCRVVDPAETPELWVDGGLVVAPATTREYVLDCPGGPAPVVGLRTTVEVVEPTEDRYFGVEDGVLSWRVESARGCTLYLGALQEPVDVRGERPVGELSGAAAIVCEGERRVVMRTDLR
ncbi:MAG: hypothetical protein AAGF12_30980 [Myxococcota bacterium]